MAHMITRPEFREVLNIDELKAIFGEMLTYSNNQRLNMP